MRKLKVTLKQSIQFLMLSLSLLLSSSSIAANNDVDNAENRVLNVTKDIVMNLEVNKSQYKANHALLDEMVRGNVLPFIDFEAMAKLTLGKYWRTASDFQRTRFINTYREMLLRSYSKLMLKYAGANIRAGNSVAGAKAGYVTVRTIVTPRGSSPIVANYDVRNNSGDWKAYNVQIAGINLITNFRTNFTREVSTKGLDALILRLENIKK